MEVQETQLSNGTTLMTVVIPTGKVTAFRQAVKRLEVQPIGEEWILQHAEVRNGEPQCQQT